MEASRMVPTTSVLAIFCHCVAASNPLNTIRVTREFLKTRKMPVGRLS